MKRSSNHRSLLQKVDGSCESIREQGELAAEEPRQKRGRITGVTVKGVTVKESPEWLQNKLRIIGLRPINNVVDITNYIVHAFGQPLHCFDADKIKGGEVIVKTMPEGTPSGPADNCQ